VTYLKYIFYLYIYTHNGDGTSKDHDIRYFSIVQNLVRSFTFD